MATNEHIKTSAQVGLAILQYYRHYAILGYAISISQTFSHINNIAHEIYRRISPHIAGTSDGLNKYTSTIITRC